MYGKPTPYGLYATAVVIGYYIYAFKFTKR